MGSKHMKKKSATSVAEVAEQTMKNALWKNDKRWQFFTRVCQEKIINEKKKGMKCLFLHTTFT